MPFSDYHAQFFAYGLTNRCVSDSVEKLAGAVAGTQVDLNPHQLDAALFRLPLAPLPERSARRRGRRPALMRLEP